MPTNLGEHLRVIASSQMKVDVWEHGARVSYGLSMGYKMFPNAEKAKKHMLFWLADRKDTLIRELEAVRVLERRIHRDKS